MAFVSVEFRLSERTACKLLGVERSSYRYEPRPDRNIELREEAGEAGAAEAALRLSHGCMRCWNGEATR